MKCSCIVSQYLPIMRHLKHIITFAASCRYYKQLFKNIKFICKHYLNLDVDSFCSLSITFFPPLVRKYQINKSIFSFVNLFLTAPVLQIILSGKKEKILSLSNLPLSRHLSCQTRQGHCLSSLQLRQTDQNEVSLSESNLSVSFL